MTKDGPVRRDARGRYQVRGPIGGSWECAEVQDAFLLHLAETSNVLRSCAAVGKTASGAYALRRRDPRFEEKWRLALCEAAQGLEALLIEWARAEATLPLHPDGAPDRDAMTRMTPRLAMQMLGIHRDAVRAGRPAAAMSADALRGVIAARLSALATEIGGTIVADETVGVAGADGPGADGPGADGPEADGSGTDGKAGDDAHG